MKDASEEFNTVLRGYLRMINELVVKRFCLEVPKLSTSMSKSVLPAINSEDLRKLSSLKEKYTKDNAVEFDGLQAEFPRLNERDSPLLFKLLQEQAENSGSPSLTQSLKEHPMQIEIAEEIKNCFN